MGATDACQYADGRDIIVAVLDTGVNGSRADLSGQVLTGYKTVSDNSDTADINKHGTWVAGVIAAKTNNYTSVASVAPGTKILPIRITNDSGGWAYFSDMTEGIRWAADNGAKVANLSYGVKCATTNQGLNHVFSFSWDSTTWVDGTYRLTTRATDLSGNGGFSREIFVQVQNAVDSANDDVDVVETRIYSGGQLK